jgi:hypothetical protein
MSATARVVATQSDSSAAIEPLKRRAQVATSCGKERHMLAFNAQQVSVAEKSKSTSAKKPHVGPCQQPSQRAAYFQL